MKFDKDKLKETILLAAAAALTSVLIKKLANWATKQVIEKSEARSDRDSN